MKRKNWVLTGSVENLRATRERGFSIIGLKELRRPFAEKIEPGDRLFFYVTKRQAFGGVVEIKSEMFEDRAKIWPGKPGKVDPYPWRFETEPVLVLEEDEFVPAEQLAPKLEHVRKWPAEHWRLAFQGQMREVSEADARVIQRSLEKASRAARAA